MRRLEQAERLGERGFRELALEAAQLRSQLLFQLVAQIPTPLTETQGVRRGAHAL
jgi:hypothetical protein